MMTGRLFPGMWRSTASDQSATGCRVQRAPGQHNKRRNKRHSRNTIALLVVIIAVLLLPLTPSSANEAAFRDLNLAQRNLVEARGQLEATQLALEGARTQLQSSHIEREFLSGTDNERLAMLEAWRRRSRQLAVEAYIGGPDVGAQVYLIDPQRAADLTYQGILLQEHTQTAVGASVAYSSLIDSSDDVLVGLVDAIDVQWRRIESLENDVANAERRVADAEWVVHIAQIHHEADAEFTSRNRAEPTPTQWHELRMCESTNNYRINSGNGFYGAYQFDYTTWFTVGGENDTYAYQAPPEEQDARARLLFSRRGSQPWPVCGRFLNG